MALLKFTWFDLANNEFSVVWKTMHRSQRYFFCPKVFVDISCYSAEFSKPIMFVNCDIDTVVLNTINPMKSKTRWHLFHGFTYFIYAKLISQMGNDLGECESMYRVKKVENFGLRKILGLLELSRLHWSHCISLEA